MFPDQALRERIAELAVLEGRVFAVVRPSSVPTLPAATYRVSDLELIARAMGQDPLPHSVEYEVWFYAQTHDHLREFLQDAFDLLNRWQPGGSSPVDDTYVEGYRDDYDQNSQVFVGRFTVRVIRG